MINRRQFLVATTTAAAAAVAGCTGNDGSGSNGATTAGDGGNGGTTVTETSDVSMTGSQFEPRNIHVTTGTTVTWTNDDSFKHTVTSASDNWSMDTSVAAGEQTKHTFETDGVYDVYCTIHGSADLTGMSMKVAVGDATIQSPLGGGGSDGGSSGDGDGGGGGYY